MSTRDVAEVSKLQEIVKLLESFSLRTSSPKTPIAVMRFGKLEVFSFGWQLWSTVQLLHAILSVTKGALFDSV